MSFAHRGTLGHRVRVLLCVAALVVAGMSASAGVGSADEWGARALLLILLRPATFTTAPLIAAGELAHDKAWYEDRIHGPYGPLGFNRGRNVVEYYDALSRGKFTFNPAGTVEVVDSPLGGLVDNNTRRRNARQLAANAGFNYSDYDHNSDGRVTTNELAILTIDAYSDGSGQTGDPGCDNLSGVDVCSSVALAGHRSDLMNYAHELSHLLSPGSLDLYGYRSCHSQNLTLLSCTSDGRRSTSPDEVFGYFMDPWHRERYGWNGSDRTVPLFVGGSGSQIVGPLGLYLPGTVETLTLQGPDYEAITFESRFRGLNQYEDGLAAEGLLAWFRKTDSSGEPLNIPSLLAPTPADCQRQNPTRSRPRCEDRAVFSLAPVNFQLDPNDVGSRGKVGTLGAGDYRVVWLNGTDSGFLIRVEPGFLTYTVSWSHSITIPPLLPPIFLPTLPPWPGPFPASP